MSYVPTSRRDLGLKCQAEYAKYRSWLEAGCRALGYEIGVDIAGIDHMERVVGRDKAKVRYAECMAEIHRLNQAFLDKDLVVDREKEAADNRAMAIKRAKQAVQFASDFLGQETERAAICVKYGVCTLEEAEEIVDDAEEKLEDAQEELEAIRAADLIPTRDREKLIRDSMETYVGPRNKKDRPKLKPFRVHANIANVTFEEILRYSK